MTHKHTPGTDLLETSHQVIKLRHELELAAAQAKVAEAEAEAIRALGFDEETVKVLDLIPLVDVAWAEGEVSKGEADLIREVMRLRGLTPNDRGWQLIESFLVDAPSEVFFNRALELVRKIYDALPGDKKRRAREDLVNFCIEVADASGGFFGLGRVSNEERHELKKIIDALGASYSERIVGVLEG